MSNHVDSEKSSSHDTAEPVQVVELEGGNKTPNPAIGKAGDAAMRRMAGVDPNLALNTAPSAREVGGVTTGAAARAGDDDQVLSTEVKTRPEHSAGLVKKKYEKAADGVVNAARTTTTTTTEGDSKTTRVDKTAATASKVGGVEVGHSRSNEHVEGPVGQEVATKETHGASAQANLHEGHLKNSTETSTSVGENKVTNTRQNAAGYKDGHVDASHSSTTRIEDANSAESKTRTVGITGGKLKTGTGSEHETKHKVVEKDAAGNDQVVEKVDKRGKETSVALGPDGFATDHASTHIDESGKTTSTTVGVEAGKNGNASIAAAHSVGDKDGNKMTMSGKAGVEVWTSEPVKQGKVFVVTYKRTKSIAGSAGASRGPVGGQLGANASQFEEGERSFPTKDAALDFKKNADEILRGASDPTTAAGAMALEIGETRGVGSAKGVSAGADGNFEGANAGGSLSESSHQKVDVTRISKDMVEATFEKGSGDAAEVHAGGFGVTAGRGKSSSESSDVTVRFDLSKPEGKQAFEKFVKDHEIPKRGGTLVSQETDKTSESHDGMSIAGGVGTAQDTSTVREHDRKDATGDHKVIDGKQGHDVNAGRVAHFLGDKDQHSSVEIIERAENGKAAGYSVEAHMSGESGTFDRAKMRTLMGVEDNFDESKVNKAHSNKNEWTMSADIDPKAIASLEKYDQRFKGLSQDDRMRLLAQQVADKGAHAINNIEGMGSHSLDWDIELKGDPNFPGREGRASLEEMLRTFTKQLATPSTAGMVAVETESVSSSLKARRAAVQDPAGYQDLPAPLRAQQLALIDREIGRFETLKHQALVAATANHAGEPEGDVAKRHFSDNGYAGMSGVDREVAKVRDEISIDDASIRRDYPQIDTALAALTDAGSHHTNMRKASAYPKYRQRADAGFKAGGALAARHVGEFKALDGLRLKLVEARTPEATLAAAKELAPKVRAQLGLLEEARSRLSEASKAQANINKSGNMGAFAAYWSEIESEMDDSDRTQDVEEDTALAAPTEKKTPMKLANK